MLELRRLNKKKIELIDALEYIKENSPKNIDKEYASDEKSLDGALVKRVYTIVSKSGIIDEFTILNEGGLIYLTHIFKNPNANLDLEDDDFDFLT